MRYEIAMAWNLVKPSYHQQRAWKRILPTIEEKEGLDFDEEDISVAAMLPFYNTPKDWKMCLLRTLKNGLKWTVLNQAMKS